MKAGMKGLGELAKVEFRLNLRDPMMVFWSFAFPALWFVLMAAVIPGPIPGFEYHGLNSASLYFPAAISLVMVSASFIGLPMTLAGYRETGVLRRLRVTPVRVWTLALGLSASQFAFVLVGTLLLGVVGIAFMGVRVQGSIAAFVGVFLFGMVTFFALGGAVGSIAGSFRSASIISWIMFLPMIFLSELFIPLSQLPGWLRPVARAMPLTPVNTMLRDIVYGAPLADLWRLGVIGGWLLASVLITLRFFRWE